MLYLLGARNHPFIRALLGAVLIVAGVIVHGATLLVLLGGVLFVWGTVAGVTRRYRRRAGGPR
jgi:UDP-N-acetylmuramyl pentapeptide phosphotransferase/UDP-N-acetylglucosamine-1-phosphate transferase